MRKLITYILAFPPLLSAGQQIDNTLSYSSFNTDTYVRLTYDNDFFTATDKYYTQGIQLEVAVPVFKKAFYRNAFIHPFHGEKMSGIAIQHNAYTPTNIIPDVILYNDRPYTATLMLQLFNTDRDTNKRQRFTSTLNLGVMGPHAGGKWMQESIHSWLDNVQPGGWKYQLSNDVIVNYTANYERTVLSFANHFMLNALGSAALGTMNDKVSVGFNVMTGSFNDFYGIINRKKFRTYIYAQPLVSFIGYNATLQGGMFAKTNIYSIQAKDIERLVFSGRAGIIFQIAGIYLEHFYAISTKEFTTQKNSFWGGLQIGVAF
jgi:hypothetical protein